MKHKLLKVMILLILLGGAIFSCRQEFTDLMGTVTESPAIDEARQWYESNKTQWVALKVAHLKEGKLNAKPDWKHAYTKKHENFTTVQVPLSVQGMFGFTTPEGI